MKLNDLAKKYGTDKKIPDGVKCTNGLYGHGYTPTYESIIKIIKPKKLLEIGISFGGSIRMWSEYLPNTNILAFDINENRAKFSDFNLHNVKLLLGDQSDVKFLNTLKDKYDIIIDDGSHKLNHILTSFNVLFNYLNDNGVYVIEDIHVNPDIEKYFENHKYLLKKYEDSRLTTKNKLLLVFKSTKTLNKLL